MANEVVGDVGEGISALNAAPSGDGFVHVYGQNPSWVCLSDVRDDLLAAAGTHAPDTASAAGAAASFEDMEVDSAGPVEGVDAELDFGGGAAARVG